jgi:hypothetical protein
MDMCPRVSRAHFSKNKWESNNGCVSEGEYNPTLHKIARYPILKKDGKRQKILKSEQWFLKFDSHILIYDPW